MTPTLWEPEWLCCGDVAVEVGWEGGQCRVIPPWHALSPWAPTLQPQYSKARSHPLRAKHRKYLFLQTPALKHMANLHKKPSHATPARKVSSGWLPTRTWTKPREQMGKGSSSKQQKQAPTWFSTWPWKQKTIVWRLSCYTKAACPAIHGRREKQQLLRQLLLYWACQDSCLVKRTETTETPGTPKPPKRWKLSPTNKTPEKHPTD